MEPLYKKGTHVIITAGAYANRPGVVEKEPSEQDNVDMEEKWLEAGGPDGAWGDEPTPDMYHVRLSTCVHVHSECQMCVVTYLLDTDIVAAVQTRTRKGSRLRVKVNS